MLTQEFPTNFFGIIKYVFKKHIFVNLSVCYVWSSFLFLCINRFLKNKTQIIFLTAFPSIHMFFQRYELFSSNCSYMGKHFFMSGGFFSNYEKMKWFCFYEKMPTPKNCPKVLFSIDDNYNKSFVNDLVLSKILSIFFPNFRKVIYNFSFSLVFFFQIWASKRSLILTNFLFIMLSF